jgi:hypothetical protein
MMKRIVHQAILTSHPAPPLEKEGTSETLSNTFGNLRTFIKRLRITKTSQPAGEIIVCSNKLSKSKESK